MKSIIVTILVLAIIGVGLWLLINTTAPKETFTSQVLSSKVVYTLLDGSVNDLRSDCRERGGEFNTCGSMCEEGEICATVCVYTCELPQISTDFEQISADDSVSVKADDPSTPQDTSTSSVPTEQVSSEQGVEEELDEAKENPPLAPPLVRGEDEATENENIKVTSPSLNQTLTSPITVAGQAKAEQVIIRVTNKSGATLIEESANVHGGSGEQFGNFSIKINYAFSATKEGFIEVAESGSQENLVKIPVRFD